MTDDRHHTCQCGKMEWRIAPTAPGTHLVCYCADCQTYANVLDHGATRVDSDGGTEIFQTLPANFEFLRGQDHLAVLRLSPKGILRWYAGCCGTQIANTLPGPGLPFVGAVLPPGAKGYGPITALLSTVGTAPHIKETGVLKAQLSVIGRILGGVFSPSKRASPFFNDDKTPVVAPRVLSKSERNAARPQ
ncbi:DUF6151 family protein [Marivita hallyeonensis]|uniref:CENP-V/GFA domain-containing protein n=1 Tax=Marivita hallyeonensis TaxID=996342 RepID=A0A1M5VVA1_9RHOB|nr:DUF6151 family protein [Marivita hallyeonensis]SHH79151.1 hypothetical protein SAMN05443551_3098 [Marivita hallyeonensis]